VEFALAQYRRWAAEYCLTPYSTEMTSLPYLTGYPPELLSQAQQLLEAGELKSNLERRYPDRHEVRNNKALNTYVQEIKASCMRKAAPLGTVVFDDRLRSVHQALGLHTTATRTHGTKTRKRREVRVASVFKETPPEFLRMIVVHELAHMKHADHDEKFYKLCVYMEPEYHQYELDMRLYLTELEWEPAS
jgi:predicted metal-dependent hydrolase